MRPWPTLAVAWGALICASNGVQAATITIQTVSLTATQVGLYQPLTISFGLSKGYANPYDPDTVDARFEFTGPSGIARVIPAYWTDQSPAWRAKIVPLEVGAHTCRILVNDSAGDAGSYTLSFTAVQSSERGFIRIDSRNPRYLRFDNGQPYLPVGHDVCWFGDDPNFYAWLQNMAQAGENWTRYWIVAHSGQDIEWGGGTDYQLGRYSQSNARLLDNMLEGVRTRGIYVQACLDSFTGWNLTLYSNWHENPYNTANGGMCPIPNDYFVNPEAQRYAKRRFRYIIARWAWNPAILCWEFFNEVDAVGGGGQTFWGHEADIAAWHQMMAQYIRSIDPFGHLRTTSFADDGARSSYAVFWQLPEMDIVQLHQYSLLYPSEHVSLIRQARQFGKPVIMGEADSTGDLPNQDPNGLTLHDIIWSAAAVESSAMSWWWDSWIHPKNLYPRFKPLVAFLNGEDWAPQQLAPLNYTILAGPTPTDLYGSGGSRFAVMYIRNWSAPVSGLRLRLNQVTTSGSYAVEYWDTNSLSAYRTDTVTGSAGGLVLNLPDFSRDIAIKVKHLGPVLNASPASLTATAYIPDGASAQAFTITNIGAGSVNYAITANVPWLSMIPGSGSVTGESDTIAVEFVPAGLTPGTHEGIITVADVSGFTPPTNVTVSLTLSGLPGDLDLDGDVDQADFGRVQACMTANGVPQTDPNCAGARFDGDPDVDQFDVIQFLNCLSGPGVPGSPACLN